MKTRWIGMGLCFLMGGMVMLSGQALLKRADAVPKAPVASHQKRIFVPFMHMRNIGAGAGYQKKPGEDHIDGGSEVEIWNLDDARPLTITEIYFTAPDGKTVLEGSKYGLPLPLELKPHTEYHFNSFYEHLKLPVPEITKERANFIHGYLADIRWEGPAPRVRGWDLGVKNGQYYSSMPVAVFEE
jgi:hypothetical protein